MLKDLIETYNRTKMNAPLTLKEKTALDYWWSHPYSDEKGNLDKIHVIIDAPTLDGAKIVNSPVIGVKNFEFRPKTWEQFIGQTESKELAKSIIIPQFKRGIKSHIILSAIRGHGKSSFVKLLANDIQANLIERIGNTVTLNTLPDIINEINHSVKPTIFFIDEIDTCPKDIIKLLNPIIESFEISGKKIKPFLFASATINKNLLVKNNPDTLDRIKHHINFTRYSVNDLIQIAKQVHEQLYREEIISNDIFQALGDNCKRNPRTIINLLENYVVCPNINQVLKASGIVKDGLTWIDVKILKFLNECNKPVGANAIAMKCALSQKEYEGEFEPILFEFGYINRVPSRIITEKGKEFLKSII
jgi:Holliday junction resolvasome RuvABC ATP-dependent DNA helicase subunit